MRQSSFSKKLITWHLENKRDLPWKQTKDPYKIWLSEVILQQTRVHQGMPYYLRFVEMFPNVHALASAKEDTLMKVWEGLGYYSRARNLHKSAIHISKNLNGIFPSRMEDIQALSGVGPYTAAAIASFAYELQYPVVDGNVLRFISRYKGITSPIDQPLTIKEIRCFLEKEIQGSQPSLFNQAIMDIGAVICTPKKPNCNACPVNELCAAKKQDLISIIPSKSKKVKRRIRYFNYLYLVDEQDNVVIKKRAKGDIWTGLYDFPCVETTTEHDFGKEEASKMFPNFLKKGKKWELKEVVKEKKHVLTHQDIHAIYYIVEANYSLKIREIDYYLVKRKNLANFAFPKMIEKLLDYFNK